MVKNDCKILFVHNGAGRFVQLDLSELRKRFQVTECHLQSRRVNPLAIWRVIKEHDVVFGWFASWHTWLPFEFAKLLGKPSVLVAGGYDVANMPEIDYGHQRGGAKRWVSRRTLRLATRLVTNSNYSKEEIARNIGLTNGRVNSIYHGVPDSVGDLPSAPKSRMALTVANVDRSTLRRKGLEAFVKAAAFLPDVTFVLAGNWKDDAVDQLRRMATSNVTFTGRLTDQELNDYYRKASVYVQASHHEGFGLSVAEAMLAGCIPVVTRAGALPEVVGSCGFLVNTTEPNDLAQAVERALNSSEDERGAVRQRILNCFPMAARGRRLEELITPLIS